MKVVGICGGIHHGKSTLAEFLTEIDPERSLHLETSLVITDIANPFNAALRPFSGSIDNEHVVSITNSVLAAITPDMQRAANLDIDAKSLAIDESDIAAHPEWYERLYQYMRQVRHDATLLEHEINPVNNDAYRPLMQWLGGYILYRLGDNNVWYRELFRRARAAKDISLVAMTAPRQPAEAEYVQAQEGQVLKIFNPSIVSDTSDVTESGVAAIKPDAEVINNGSIDDLQQLARTIRRDVLASNLQPRYVARP